MAYTEDTQIFDLDSGTLLTTDRFPNQKGDGSVEAKYNTIADIIALVPATDAFDYELLDVTGTNSSTANILTKSYTDVESGGGSYVKLPTSPTIGQKVLVANTDGTMNLHVVCASPQFMYPIGSFSGSGNINPGVTTGTLYTFLYLGANKWVYFINTSV